MILFFFSWLKKKWEKKSFISVAETHRIQLILKILVAAMILSDFICLFKIFTKDPNSSELFGEDKESTYTVYWQIYN